MWKTLFLAGMALSLEVEANTCNIQDIEGLVALIKQAPQEKHYRETINKFLELKYAQDIQKKSPEFSVNANFEKADFSNNDIEAEVLFDVDQYRVSSLRNDTGQADKKLRQAQYQKEHLNRVNTAVLALYKISQGQFLLGKISELSATLSSSESAYKNRPIRSREEEIVLGSLGLLRSNLQLKESGLRNEVAENASYLKRWNIVDCQIRYESFAKMIGLLKRKDDKEKDFVPLRLIQLQSDLDQKIVELEKIRSFNNLKIGPNLTREKVASEINYRFGVTLSFDLPSFSSTNTDYVNQSKIYSAFEADRLLQDAELERTLINERFKKHSESLSRIPSFEKLEADIKRIKQSFDRGIVSPLVYLDSYRSYVDFLEAAEEVRLGTLESYLNLRGLYDENNI